MGGEIKNRPMINEKNSAVTRQHQEQPRKYFTDHTVRRETVNVFPANKSPFLKPSYHEIDELFNREKGASHTGIDHPIRNIASAFAMPIYLVDKLASPEQNELKISISGAYSAMISSLTSFKDDKISFTKLVFDELPKQTEILASSLRQMEATTAHDGKLYGALGMMSKFNNRLHSLLNTYKDLSIEEYILNTVESPSSERIGIAIDLFNKRSASEQNDVMLEIMKNGLTLKRIMGNSLWTAHFTPIYESFIYDLMKSDAILSFPQNTMDHIHTFLKLNR